MTATHPVAAVLKILSFFSQPLLFIIIIIFVSSFSFDDDEDDALARDVVRLATRVVDAFVERMRACVVDADREDIIMTRSKVSS